MKDRDYCERHRASMPCAMCGLKDGHGDLPLFSQARSDEARDEAVAQVDEHNEDWVGEANSAIAGLAKLLSEFTTDDVWKVTGPAPEGIEPRAMGAAMQRASGSLIEPTDTYKKSAQVSCHSRPKRVWRSLVFKP